MTDWAGLTGGDERRTRQLRRVLEALGDSDNELMRECPEPCSAAR